jgi:hypothetical protein
MPGDLAPTVTALFNRVAVQVDRTASFYSGLRVEGTVDATVSGALRRGTELLKRYDADESYGNVFNLPENSAAAVDIIIRLIDPVSGRAMRTFDAHVAVTTLSSATPQQAVPNVYYIDPVNGNTPPTGNGSLGNPYRWLNSRTWTAGDTLVIMNGDFRGGSTPQQSLRGAVGSAANWIRVVPYSVYSPGNGDAEAERFTREVELNGTWSDEGDGVFSMPLVANTHFNASSGDHLGNIYDTSISRQLYPFKTKDAFDAGTIGDGTGYHIVLAGTSPTLTATLYVRLTGGANPGTSGRLLGAYGIGLPTRNLQYVYFDHAQFFSCGFATGIVGDTDEDSGIASSPGGVYLDSTDTEVKYVAFVGCRFERNTTDIATRSSANGIHHVLVDDVDFVFDGPWPHFFEAYDYTEADPFVSTTSWSHVKGSAWEIPAILFTTTGSPTTSNINEAFVVRNSRCRGKQFLNMSNGDFRNGKHLHVHDIEITEVWDDAIGDIDLSGSAINAALHGIEATDAYTLISLSPYNEGPLWLFASSIDGYVNVPFKIGDQEATDESHGYKTIANISCVAKGFTDTTLNPDSGACKMNGAHSGVRAANLVLKEYQNGTGGGAGGNYWYAQNNIPDTYTVDANRINEWNNSLFHMMNRAGGGAVVPEVRVRLANDTENDYASFALASAAVGAVDTNFPNCVGTYSSNGGTDPFPTGITGGLNAGITTKSVEVRGVTDLAGNGGGDAVALASLPIGSFPLRDPE